MDDIFDESRNALHYIISRVSEIVLDAFIFLLAGSYLVVILARKTFRSNKLNWPTVNIAFTTALFALIHLLFTGTHLGQRSITSCRLQGFLVDMAASHMMYAYCTSSFTRLLVIRYFTKPKFRSRSWLISNIVICWLAGLLFAIPHVFYDNFTCAHNGIPLLFKVYTCITTVILPVLIVAVCNVSIFRFISQVGRRIRHTNSIKINNQQPSSKRDLRLSKIMLFTFSLFLIGWTPVLLEGLFLTHDHRLPPYLSLIFELLLPISLLGQMVLLIYANQPLCQYLKEKLTRNDRFLFVVRLS